MITKKIGDHCVAVILVHSTTSSGRGDGYI
jgi:hypothetical protein